MRKPLGEDTKIHLVLRAITDAKVQSLKHSQEQEPPPEIGNAIETY